VIYLTRYITGSHTAYCYYLTSSSFIHVLDVKACNMY